MAKKMLKRYGLESGARILVVIGLLFNLFAWFVAAYYFVHNRGNATLFVVPLTFSCVSVILLIAMRYRYTLFEKYPYLMNLPSIFYHIGEGRNGQRKQSMAFSMIFTVHALVLAAVGFMGLLLTISVSSSIKSSMGSSFLILYLLTVAILIVSVLLQYRRIYIKFSE
ncbi:MAG: hypothetical protein KGH67_01255 [Candidatus Micrarchaeota archaeon]|nr:hypothetical protein [Candidatus Micrarchaeota archaeon]